MHDQYSISFRLVPLTAIPGPALVFGNDFDSPIRDRLPPGFGTALRIVKWAIDPGIDGDVYGDKPFLYGNALSSVNVLRVGGKEDEEGKGKEGDGVGKAEKEKDPEKSIEEGGEGSGEMLREELGVPAEAEQRKKWFLAKGRTEDWVWEKDRVYWCDFFNPYVDFNREISPASLFFPFFPRFPSCFLLLLFLSMFQQLFSKLKDEKEGKYANSLPFDPQS